MSLELQLVLTEKCNFMCDYCYLSFRNTRLTVDKFNHFYENVLDELLEKYEQKYFHIVFFGGEPLLEQDLIDDLYELIKDDPRCEHMKVVTNGALLTNDLAEKYKNMDIRLSISYDGIWQDSNRSKEVPEDSILHSPATLNQYVDSVHCMVRPENVSTLCENFEYFVHLGLIPDFTIVEDDVWSDEDVKAFGQMLDLLVESNVNTIKNCGKPIIAGFFTHWLRKILKPSKTICSLGSGVSLSPDGNVYPCARFTNDKTFPVWNMDGGICDDTINFMRKVNLVDSWHDCKTCTLNKYCNAGCVHVQMHKGSVVPQLCELYKMLYHATLNFFEKTGDEYIIRVHIENVMRDLGELRKGYNYEIRKRTIL